MNMPSRVNQDYGTNISKRSMDSCPYQMVLIDDDEIYREIFRKIANSMKVNVTTYASIAEMISFAFLNKFDIAIIDYHLENFKGTEIAEYIDIFFPDLPVVLISALKNIPVDKDSPESIKKFCSKSSQPQEIIGEAISILNRIDYYSKLRNNKATFYDMDLSPLSMIN